MKISCSRKVLLLANSFALMAGADMAWAADGPASEPVTSSSTQVVVGRNATERLISTIAPGRVSKFTVSPNGRRVAYLAYANGKPEQVSEEGASGPIAVFLDGKKGNRQYPSDQMDKPIRSLVFSPDSKRLAYRAEYSGTSIYADGLGEENFGSDDDKNKPENFELQNVSEPRFSPDGKHVVYAASNYQAKGPSYVVLDGKKLKPYPQIVDRPVFSPDSTHLAYVVQFARPDGQAVIVDGQEGKIYKAVDTRYVTFSPDSKKLAYIAGSGQDRGPNASMKYFVVANGQEGKHYFAIGNDLHFSPDSQRMLYAAKITEKTWSVVVDGTEGKYHDAWNVRNLSFSPDSRRFAYVVSTKVDVGDEFVVIDGQEGKRYKRVWLDHVQFSSDSLRTAYPASDGRDWFIVEGKKEGKHYTFVAKTTFSPDGVRLAYVAYSGATAFVVLDGQEGKRYDKIENLVFSPDGKYLAYAAYTKTIKKWFVVVNGQEGKGYDFVMAKNAAETQRDASESIETGSLQFDSPNAFHYLVVSGKRILLVEEELSTSNLNVAPKQ